MTPVGIGWRHPHYGELLETLPALDFIEVHSENFFGQGGAALAVLEQARQTYPVSLHGVGLALGSAVGVDEWHLEQLAQLVRRVEPVRVSDHACFARAPVGGEMVHAADLLPLPFNDQALAVLCTNVQRVQERLGRAIMVENLSAYVQFADSDRTEVDFLGQLVRRTGCQLLVDVNNIYVNALNAQRESPLDDPVSACKRWIDAIPAASVGQIHLAGHCVMNDIVIDDHGSQVCEPVWTLYEYAQERFATVPALIEWDTGIPSLAVLLAEAQRAQRVGQP